MLTAQEIFEAERAIAAYIDNYSKWESYKEHKFSVNNLREDTVAIGLLDKYFRAFIDLRKHEEAEETGYLDGEEVTETDEVDDDGEELTWKYKNSFIASYDRAKYLEKTFENELLDLRIEREMEEDALDLAAEIMSEEDDE